MNTRTNLWRRLAVAMMALLMVSLGSTPFVFAANAPATSPQISVSLRGDGSGTIEAGEPFHVAVRLAAPRGATQAIELAPSSGSWADAVLVELRPATGAAVAAKAEVAGQPETATAMLDAKRIAGGLWRFSTTATRGLAPGDYRLRARLVIKAGTGWTGETTTDDVPVRVVAATAAGSANVNANATSSERIAARAQDALLTGQIESAAGILDEALKKTPLDARLLAVRASVAERAGNFPAAAICANAALRASAKAPVQHPNGEFLALQGLFDRARRATAGLSANSPTAPAWSWPPIEVITAINADAAKSEFGKSLSAAPRTAVAAPAVSSASAPANGANATAVPVPVAPAKAVAAVSTTAAPAAAPGAAPIGVVPAASETGAAPGAVVEPKELAEEKIPADSAGQWAASATAASQYSSPNYSAAKLTGAPDVPKAGDNFNAWCPANDSKTDEWVELVFAQPVHATEIRVRQSNAPGAIVKVEAFEPNGTAHLWWSGTDPVKSPSQASLAWFAVRVPRTSYLVAKMKLTLNLAAVPGWNEIDAVQLVGAP